MSAKHTPGPWLRDGRLVYALVHSGAWRKGKEILVNRFSCNCQKGLNCDEEEANANARLIAAAPCLLEALEAVMANCVYYDEKHISAQKARAAIAKAKGESNE